MTAIPRLATLAALAAALLFATDARAEPPRIVLVHGMNMDGSAWRGVHAALVKDGFPVTVVQQPLDGFERDVEAVERVLDREDGNVLLVGHSYGGVVITTAGNHPAVDGLVYVAALQPDVGETMGSLNEAMPSLFDPAGVVADADGYVRVSPHAFRRDVGPDLAEEDASFLIDSQVPTSPEVFAAQTTDPAWRHKPSFGVVAAADRVLSPDLQRWMYERSGTTTVEIDAGHLLVLTQPHAVAKAIADAARRIETD